LLDRWHRFWWRPAAPAHRNGGSAEVLAGGLTTHARLALDPPQRPAESAQCFYLLSLLVAQDVRHPAGGPQWSASFVDVPERLSVAGFQVIIGGRFWVITEGRRRHPSSVAGKLNQDWFDDGLPTAAPRNDWMVGVPTSAGSGPCMTPIDARY
jgi:hypothetical protein